MTDFLLEISGALQRKIQENAQKEVQHEEDGQTWTLYTDGDSSREGSGPSLILTSPTSEEVTYALHFNFYTSNNEDEYEVLLARLRLTVKMGVEKVTALANLRLAANQIIGEFETKDKWIEKYVKVVQRITIPLKSFIIKQIPRRSNIRGDTLRKLLSTCFGHLSKEVLAIVSQRTEHRRAPSSLLIHDTAQLDYAHHRLPTTWHPSDGHGEARKTRIHAPQYAILGGVMYRKGYRTPWLKFIDRTYVEKAL